MDYTSQKGISLLIHKMSELFVSFNSTILIPFFVLLVTVDVLLLRYVLNRPLSWGLELTGYLLLILFFLCATKCEEDEQHIRMEILYKFFPIRLQVFIDLLGNIFGAALFGILSYKSFALVLDMYKTGETGIEFLWVLWPFRLLLALLSLVAFGRLAIDLVTRSRLLVLGRKSL